MKKVFLLLFVVFALPAAAQYNCQSTKNVAASSSTAPIDYNPRSDTADLLSLVLNVDGTQLTAQKLFGEATYTLVALQNFSQLRFDLLGFGVDSVKSGNSTLSFTRVGEFLTVQESASAGDTLTWTIYYGGSTTKDNSGWGGMHHDGHYHYNLGVGFAANPHVYGRSLFPCFDNFVEKCVLSEMNITTGAGKMGVSNGLLNSVDTLSNGNLVWRWEGWAPLPSYLISFAVSDYHKIAHTHDSIPFEVYGRHTDTANINDGFVHLNDIYDAFVDAFGPYYFEKVGYALTITGAMEHAGMVHLPRNLANANLQGEDIIAHELAHMWFGNALTTKRAEDMWINEGFAEFGSHLYERYVYGDAKYLTTIRRNQALVLKNAAKQDGGHKALSGVGQNITYGTHTYQKGAMVAHNLMEFLGDSLFKHTIETVIAAHPYGNVDAASFQDALELASGVDLDDFFDDWIYNPGYHGAVPGGPQASTGQNQYWPYHFIQSGNADTTSLESMPVHVYLHSYTKGFLGKVESTPASTTGWNAVPIATGVPVDWVSINDGGESLGASTHDVFTWAELSSGSTTLYNTEVTIFRKPNPDSLNGTFHIWHHWGNPWGNSTVTKNHYWEIQYEGTDSTISYSSLNELPFKVYFPYDSRAVLYGKDHDIMGMNEDSVALFHTGQGGNFQLHPTAVKNVMINGNNGFGRLELDSVSIGSYAIGTTQGLSLDENHKSNTPLKVYPNPTTGEINIQVTEEMVGEQLIISSAKGQILHQEEIKDCKYRVVVWNPIEYSGSLIITVGNQSEILQVSTRL